MNAISTSTRRADGLRIEIENDIVAGRYRPGERLDEVSLAQRFGVSRTPIREALIELSSSGLIEMRPRRGAFVRQIGVMQLVEMFEVMAELEAVCGRLAARRMNETDRAALNAAHEDCRRAVECEDADAYYMENQRFHEAIYRSARNAFLEEHVTQLRDRLRTYRRLQLRVHHRMRTSFAEHQRIVEALVAGDAEAAEAGLRAHVRIQGERFADFVASLQDRAG